MGCIVILTLERHQDGIWIRRLVEELNTILSCSSVGHPSTTVEVRSLEIWMGQGFEVASATFFSDITGIVNRVSDAAPPALFKACVAILTVAQSLGIPVVNGPNSYSLCANKWCQHVLFQQAGLKSPPTKAFYNTAEHPVSLDVDEDDTRDWLGVAVVGQDDSSFSVLVKPNSGGFGAGITKLDALPQHPPIFDDGITLVQHYVPPKNHKLYRVWFLNGKIQCAVERTVQDEASEFTGACAGGTTCSIRPPALEAFVVPNEVRAEIESQLLPLLPDALCGSVEYLCSLTSSGDDVRLYFDLNLLSTLPIKVSDPNNAWPHDYNPWSELAQCILKGLELLQ